MLALVFLEQELGSNAWSFWLTVVGLHSSLPLDVFRRDLIPGIDSATPFCRFGCQHLCLEGVLTRIHHVGRKRMLINLHRFGRFCRHFKFESALLNGRLYLLSEDFALIGIM